MKFKELLKQLGKEIKGEIMDIKEEINDKIEKIKRNKQKKNENKNIVDATWEEA
jgi:hypothetical protein